MEWAPWPFLLPLLIEIISDRECVWIRLNDAIQCRPVLVNGIDACEVFLSDHTRSEFPGLHSLLEFIHRNLIQLKSGSVGPQVQTGSGPRDRRSESKNGPKRCSHSAHDASLQKAPAWECLSPTI